MLGDAQKYRKNYRFMYEARGPANVPSTDPVEPITILLSQIGGMSTPVPVCLTSSGPSSPSIQEGTRYGTHNVFGGAGLR